MFRPMLTIAVGFSILLAGCRHPEPSPSGLIRQPGWWERRLDRLETWNRRNGYPLDKAKDGTMTTIGYTLVGVAVVGAALGGIILWAHAEQEEQKNARNQPIPGVP
jgi:hypothetical protein